MNSPVLAVHQIIIFCRSVSQVCLHADFVFCACDYRPAPMFHPQSGKEYLSNLVFLSRFTGLRLVDIAEPLRYVVLMSPAFSTCPLLPNVGRLSVVLQRVRLLAVVPFMFIRPLPSAVNDSHHAALEDQLQVYG
ncbi:hypothetical protein TNCV_2483371 [Trichonephila clavipes]|uniref:Uncharacterized protein n=1 Tax=Trichonephila clavipes TaxID=2585209 RepID=A0A8X7BAM6_TRICX|nr:hypothetical protein TNCV_2483371 [Trichonephila clavipes]